MKVPRLVVPRLVVPRLVAGLGLIVSLGGVWLLHTLESNRKYKPVHELIERALAENYDAFAGLWRQSDLSELRAAVQSQHETLEFQSRMLDRSLENASYPDLWARVVRA